METELAARDLPASLGSAVGIFIYVLVSVNSTQTEVTWEKRGCLRLAREWASLGDIFLIANLSRRTQPCVGNGWWWDHSGSFL